MVAPPSLSIETDISDVARIKRPIEDVKETSSLKAKPNDDLIRLSSPQPRRAQRRRAATVSQPR
eukprot:Awhi_evm3s9253